MAAAFPLFFGIASKEQAGNVTIVWKKNFFPPEDLSLQRNDRISNGMRLTDGRLCNG